MEMVELEELTEEDEKDLKQLIKNHFKYTNSEYAFKVLDNWNEYLKHFVKVMPKDYKKALIRLENEKLINEKITA
jgi:glutamate synthase (ferredoxin)